MEATVVHAFHAAIDDHVVPRGTGPSDLCKVAVRTPHRAIVLALLQDNGGRLLDSGARIEHREKAFRYAVLQRLPELLLVARPDERSWCRRRSRPGRLACRSPVRARSSRTGCARLAGAPLPPALAATAQIARRPVCSLVMTSSRCIVVTWRARSCAGPSSVSQILGPRATAGGDQIETNRRGASQTVCGNGAQASGGLALAMEIIRLHQHCLVSQSAVMAALV